MNTNEHEFFNTMNTSIMIQPGVYFDYSKPDECKYGVYHIAHALSNICRFGGHAPRFYSVAQHSVLVSQVVPLECQLQALFHDAHEAFTGDMPRPMKAAVPGFKGFENRIQASVLKHFGLPVEIPAIVKLADLRMLTTEKQEIMGTREPWQTDQYVAYSLKIIPQTPTEARDAFFKRYHDICSRLGSSGKRAAANG